MTTSPLVPGSTAEPVHDRSAVGGRWLLPTPVRVPAAGLGDGLGPQDLAGHLAEHGRRGTDRDLLAAVEEIGLTGRGGAHFPVAAKWRAALDAVERSGRAPVLVANGAEGEPASAKDQVLLATRPHLVLDGLADAADAVGAHGTVLWLHGDTHQLHRTVQHAVAERRAAGLREPRVRVVSAPAHYLAGESSAVVHGLSGGPALPRTRRVPAAVSGVDGRPTLVHNVETLARTGLLARTGSAGHRLSMLVTVLANGSRTVLEVGEGTRLRSALLLGGWLAGADPQAVLLGGYGGTWLRWDRARDLPLDEAGLRAAGLSLGAGVVAPLPRGACGVAEVARLAAYLASASARQCGPCLFGLSAIAATLAELRQGTGRRRDVRRLQDWAGEVAGRGACHHPDGAVRMVLTGLVAFAEDVEAHRRHRPCAGANRPGHLPVPGEDR